VDQFLDYFHRAVTDPASVPPWSVWWAENVEQVEREFPLIDYVRLKHRRLLGARQILLKRGRLPADFVPPDPLRSGSCSACGERITLVSAGPGGGPIECPNCGGIGSYDSKSSDTASITMSELTHFDEHGASRMVDVGPKAETQRTAVASAVLRMLPGTLALIRDKQVSKGDVLEVARLAGIMAAKKTAELIPLCHPLPLTSVKVAFAFPSDSSIRIEATVQVFARTGVEMEALTAVSVSALTVYDMVKAVDRGVTVEQIRLEEKHGGKSGDYHRHAEPPGPS